MPNPTEAPATKTPIPPFPEEEALVEPGKETAEEIPAGATVIESAPFPSGATLIEEEVPFPQNAVLLDDEPSIGDKIVDRFLGNDIDEDPLELTRLGTTIAGGIAGAAAGAKGGAAIGTLTGPGATIAVPVLSVAGALIGGGAGAFGGAQAPEAAIETAEFFNIVEEGTRDREGLSPEELRTVAEGEALLDLATGGGLTIARGLGRVSASVFTGARKEIAEAAARQGVDMIPVQVGGRVIGRGFVSVFGRFPLLGGGAVRRRAGKAEKQLKSAVTGLAERTGPLTDAAELGVEIFKDAKALVKATNKHFKTKYNAVFAQADELGVGVDPNNLLTKADEILEKIAAETPQAIKGEASPGPGKVLELIEGFIKKDVLPLRRLKPKKFAPVDTGVLDAKGKKILREVAPLPAGVERQTLKQMDGVITKIDQEIASLEPGQKKFALSLMNQLRQAAQRDVLENTRGIGADEVGRALRELDKEFSHTMSQLFETATAKRFGSVEKRGLRAIEFDRTTRTPVDQLARIVVNLNSPQAMEELSRVISPETLQRVAAHTLDDAMQMAMKTDGFVGQLDIEVFAKRLGFDGSNQARRRTIKKMLEKSGSDITASDLDDIIVAGRALAGFDIPNVSSFIARRGAIGGLQGIMNGVVPGLALLGGSGAVAYSASAVLGSIMFVGGSHLFSRVISNPKSARALHKVISKETNSLIRRKAAIEVLRFGLEGMRDAGEITQDTFFRLVDVTGGLIISMDNQIKSMAETPE